MSWFNSTRASLSLARVLPLLGALLAPVGVHASVLWYNGDYDNRDTLTNENYVPINTGTGYVLQKSLIYDDFVVPAGQTWQINTVYSNNQVAYYDAPTTAIWQIRSGVSSGNGGTLVASGDTTATVTPVTPVGGYYYGDTEYTISATVTGVNLSAGTYWLAVAPDSAGYYGDQSYEETTSGANAVGVAPGNDGQSFISNTYPLSGIASYSFTPTTTPLTGDGDGPLIDFSEGITGVASPEPASISLLLAGAGSIGMLRRRRGS